MLKRLIDYIHKYFGFNKRERNGLIILLGIVIILFIIRLLQPLFFEAKPIVLEKLIPEAKIDSLSEVQLIKDTGKASVVILKSIVQDSLYSFDPNTISSDEALQLGFSKKAAQTLLNFRSKGGKFKTKEDLKKLYGLTEKLYQKLEPYVLIENKESLAEKKENKFPQKQYEAKVIDVNTADSLQFLSLPMIGPAMTKRILKFRSALGGFYSAEQLREVYGMKDSVFTLIQPRLIITTASIKKINVNTATYEEMKKHPYLNHVAASTIVAYRQKHGNYKSINDLKNVGTINDDLLKKLSAYLELK